jgi:hypothetical protein
MKPTLFQGIALGAAVSVLTLGATSALAGTGPAGTPFILGKVNTVNATSTLTGSATGSMLHVVNSGTGTAAMGVHASNSSATAAAVAASNSAAGPAGAFSSSLGPAATFTVPAGQPPFTVNSTTQVPNLNAATLQGNAPSNFYAAGSTVADSSELGGQPASFYLPATGTAANSSELGGLPASSYGDRAFAVVAADGSLVVGPAVSSTQFDGAGSYDVRFTGTVTNNANCAVFVQLMSGIGWATAGPGTGTLSEFDVHVFNTAGNPANAEFSLYAIC